MKVNKHFNVSILLIIITVLTTAYSIKQNSGMNKFKQFRNKKNIIMGTLKMNGKAFRNWKTSSIARNFNKVIGFVPIIKENDIHKLLELVLNEADLIKIEALKKLSKLSYRNLSEKSKKDLIIAKLQATIELIKYYSVIYNWPKVNITFHQGLFYAYCCQKIFNDNPGECFKRKTQLLESFIFRHKIEINRGMRRWLTKTSKEAEKYLKDDKTLQFINTKIACEIKFIQANKNKLLKAVMKFYMGGTKKEKTYNCVTELKVFEKDLKEIGSYPGEYHYLLAKAYDHQGDDESTLKHLRIARKAEVVDTKTRNINKKVQEYYEKIYTRVNKFQNHYSISLL